MAVSMGAGRVNMQGAIVDTACAIEMASREQTINMGMIPVTQIVRDGRGSAHPFSIRLIDCVLPKYDSTRSDGGKFRVIFDGYHEGGHFRIRGGASGIALQITDSKGNVMPPGKYLNDIDVQPGEMQLNYFITLVANQQPLKSGSYFSTISFRLDYF